MANPGGVDLNTSPYYDDFDEDKKFVRVLYRPGRAVQARELSQAQTLQQSQVKRFADYFFKQGAIVDGCEQTLDLNMQYVKLQATYNGTEVDVTDFEGANIFGANTGLKAYAGLVEDVSGTDPKTLFINYLSSGAIVLTVNTAPSTLTVGNTITFSTGNTATIQAFYTDPITAVPKIYVSNVTGTLTATTANTVANTGSTVILNVTAVADKRANTTFDNGELLFTAAVSGRAYANAALTDATQYVVDEGLSTEETFTKGSKITVSDGVVYLADHFVKNTSQTLILDKYTNRPTYKVGFVPSKSFVDYIADNTLVDNAQGTPNYLAPGADRLKIDTVLTKLVPGETTDETEFVSLTEIEDGITKKRAVNTIDSKLEEAIAKRTSEESGDYTLSDPKINVREHLSQNSNGGRYTSGNGGNNELLLIEVDPLTSYVSGYRSELLVKKEVEVTKGLDTKYVEQTKTQINFGSYIEVKELVGMFDFMESTQVDLYDTAQQVITNMGYSTGSPTGTAIGTARIRSIEYVSGTTGTSDARYYVYMYDVTMSAGKTFAQVRSIYDSATPKRFADVVLDASGNAVLKETSFNKAIFKLPYTAVKTLRDPNDNIETGYRFAKKFSVTFTSGIATISSTDSSETFVGTGVLSSTQKNDFYQVVINNSGANVETSTLTGTVGVSAGAAAVTGSGTSFTTQLNVGDIIKINSLSRKISAITSDTALTLSAVHTTGATANTFTKILPAGSLVPLSSYGGAGTTRTVNVSSPSTLQIDIKESATFTAEVYTAMDRANAREKNKVLNYQSTANVNPNTHPNTKAGPFGLGYGDIYQLHAIYQSADFSTPATTGGTNVTSSYTLHNGQSDNAYNHGYITPNAGVVPTGRLLVVFDNFTHDTTQGLGYTSVNSYPIDDTATANTTINTKDIPTYTGSTGENYDLRDCVDFRPIKTANTSLNPVDDLGYQIPTGGLHIPFVGSDFDADLFYYRGRIVKLYVNNRGVFGINNGSAGNPNPTIPPKLPDTLELAEITIPPYPSSPLDSKIRLIKNRRYTMRDIGNINDRLEKLEYYTALGVLEKQATDKTELDADGFDRFKNGILVDPFTGHGVVDVNNADYHAAIKRNERYVTAYQNNEDEIGLKYANTSVSTTSRTVGNKILLPFTEETMSGGEQPYASRQLNLAEELTFTWVGDLQVIPATDNWLDTSRDTTQDIVYSDTGDADNWKKLADAWNTEVSPISLHWIGAPQTDIVPGTSQTTRQTINGQQFDVTRAITQTTQEAYKQLVKVTPGAEQKLTGDRVVDVSISKRMRTRDFIIVANGLKTNSPLYAFFDGINVTANCTQFELVGNTTIQDLFDSLDKDDLLPTDSSKWRTVSAGSLRVNNGKAYVKFRVPANTFYTGQREFVLTDSSTNSDGTTTTYAKTSIYAQGITQVKSTLTINTRPTSISFNDTTLRESVGRQVRDVLFQEVSRTLVIPPPPRPQNWDPVSQSFTIDSAKYRNGCYVSSIDLFFKTKSTDSTRGVTVEIREMFNGYPTRKIIGGEVARLENSRINVSASASTATTFTFPSPVYLTPGNEYCFTIKPDNNDLEYTIWVAELGGIDITNSDVETRIDKAPASGVLFTSSNDYTWSARQNLDVKYKLKVAKFNTTATKVAYWNNVNASTAIPYNVLTPMIEDQILADTNIVYELRYADSTYAVSDYITIKNFERIVLASMQQVSTSSNETSNNFKSVTLKATLSTTDEYISPYVDDERTRIVFEETEINNTTSNTLTGTLTYASGGTVVVGSGTAFTSQVTVGEYAKFGDDYRLVTAVTNNTHMTVATVFSTASAVAQTATVRNEEHPSGPYASTSRYITRQVTLNDGFEATDLVTYLNINRPAGTSIKVYYKILNENDTDIFNDKFYTEMSLVGTESFTQDPDIYKEEKYVVPTARKSGGATLLSGTVNIYSANTNVEGTSTRFTEDLRIGDTIAVGTNRAERVVATIANNTFLTVDSVWAGNAVGQDAFKVLNDTVAYTTPDGRTFEGFKYFAVKIVFLSSNNATAPKVKDLRVMALA